jgi:hypothetical protein
MFPMKPEERSLLSRMEPTGGASPTEPLSVSRVQPEQVLPVWQILLPQIRRGLKKGAGDTLDESGLFRDVASGRVILWVMHRGPEIQAGVFLRVDERECGRALIVLEAVAGGGKGFLAHAESLLPRLREYGDMIGAYTIEAYCRRGTARVLSRLGCKPKAIVMEIRDERRS